MVTRRGTELEASVGLCEAITGSSKNNLAKFSDTCSIRANGLCFCSPRLVGGRKAENSNMQSFLHHAVVLVPEPESPPAEPDHL